MNHTLLKQQPSQADVFEAVHARVLRFLPDLLKTLGGDHDLLLRRAGIDPVTFSAGEPCATYRKMVDVLERAAVELNCPDFGLRLATLQGGGVFGPLGLVMRNSRTFGDALDYVVKHTFAHSLAARIWLKRSPADRSVFVGHDILLDGLPNKSQVMEQLLLVGHLAAMEITGGHVRARKVHFRHQPVSAINIYRRYFHCDVCFGQNEDGVYFLERHLACPIIDPDTRAHQDATSYIDREFTRQRPPLPALTRGVVMQFLGTDACTNDLVAAELNLHPRTLHRRLAEAGTSFRQIKEAVRRDVMLYCIQQTDLDFSYISEKLGFAEQSVMSRCCRSWYSASPTELRAQMREADAVCRN